MNSKMYLDFIAATIKSDGYKVADVANKKALELGGITLDQYREAARAIAKAFLEG